MGVCMGHGEPVRVKRGERVLFHVLNGSATESRNLALPGYSFKVVALDGNDSSQQRRKFSPQSRAIVRGLRRGWARRPGVWIMGDLADDDRGQGTGIIVEYAGQKGKPAWTPPENQKRVDRADILREVRVPWSVSGRKYTLRVKTSLNRILEQICKAGKL